MSIGGKVIVDVKFRMLKANLDDLALGRGRISVSQFTACFRCPAAACVSALLCDPGP